MIHRSIVRLLTPLLAAALVAAGCGADVEEPQAVLGPQPVTVNNCGQQVTYQPPQRPVAYDISGAEKMFALGLADRMRGYVMNSLGDPAIAGSPWKDDYKKVERLGTARITREIVVNSRADWVLAGWGGGFSEERGITPKLLSDLGIASYIHTETCFNYGPAPADVPPLEALYADLQNLGKIFGVEDKAKTLVTDLQQRFAKLHESHPKENRAKVFVYDSGTDQPYTSGKHAAPNDIIDAAGGVNVLADLNDRWTSVSWESVAKTKPEVIVVVDYADKPAKAKVDFLRAQPALRSSPAVQQNRFVVINIGDLLSGPRIAQGAEQLAKYLRSIGR